MMPTSRDSKRWFIVFLLFSSGVPRAEIPSYDNFLRYGFRHTSVKTGFPRKLMPPSVLHSMDMLMNPYVWQLLKQLRRQGRFWTAPRGAGFWEKDVQGTWRKHALAFPDWEDKQYLDRYRVTKATFWFLFRRYAWRLQKQYTNLRKPINADNCFAITLQWLAHSTSSELSIIYRVAKASIVSIVHEGMYVLRRFLVPDSIRLPIGDELDQVIADFEALCCLPQCSGALDGTVMQIKNLTKLETAITVTKDFIAS